MIEQSHFKINEVTDFPEGMKRAYLAWSFDEGGSMRLINKLNLAQLGVEVVKAVDASPGHGWLYFRGELKKVYYTKD